MNRHLEVLRGVVHGKLIQLEREPDVDDGEIVAVSLRPLLPSGEGIRRSAGAWADEAEELDGFLSELRQSRRQSRQEPDL